MSIGEPNQISCTIHGFDDSFVMEMFPTDTRHIHQSRFKKGAWIAWEYFSPIQNAKTIYFVLTKMRFHGIRLFKKILPTFMHVMYHSVHAFLAFNECKCLK